MASIFLSYSREDTGKAERIAKALEDAGHSVWWDRELRAGERFSAEIDRALKSADFVVVLWSRASIGSAWVQDEASVGRDSNRLLPVLIEPIEPPLGFRQYHAVDLARIRGARAARAVTEAIAARLRGEPLPLRSTARSSILRRFRWQWVAGCAAVLLATALSLWLFQSRGGLAKHTVVVAANGGDMPRSQELARDVTLDLSRYETGALGILSIIPSTDRDAPNAEYHVDVALSGAGNDWRADVSLRARRNAGLLWASSIARQDASLVDIRQQATSALVHVLDCVGEAQSGKIKLNREALSLYLDGCAQLSDYNADEPGEELLGTFRQLTRKAPNFAQGWAWLALLEAQSFPSVQPRDWHALTLSAREHLRHAKQLGPDLPITTAAEAYLPENFMSEDKGLAIVERGLSNFPESSLLHAARSDFLARVGRLGEGVKEAKAAAELDPLAPARLDNYASALAYSGRTRQAFDALEQAEKIWPGSTVLNGTRYRLDLRYGDPRNALVLLEHRGSGDASPVPMDGAWRMFLQARIDPNQANIDKALAGFRKRANSRPGDWGYFQALGTFRRVDEAFAALQSDEAIDSLGGSRDAFFRVHMRPIYSDPRFIGVAQRLGLLTYWKKTGIWPDFCREPHLPYSCRKEAAKYPNS
jgi:tetratricopeptide (TPR) repeat protein